MFDGILSAGSFHDVGRGPVYAVGPSRGPVYGVGPGRGPVYDVGPWRGPEYVGVPWQGVDFLCAPISTLSFVAFHRVEAARALPISHSSIHAKALFFKLYTNTDDVDRTKPDETMTHIGRLWRGGRMCSEA